VTKRSKNGVNRERIQAENGYARAAAFVMAAEYGIDTPESRAKQAEFIRQIREAIREEVVWVKSEI
jgi:hypothetical protein